MSKTNTVKKRRISIELDEHLCAEMEKAKQSTGLGFPELGKVGLIKVIREWRKSGAVTAETLSTQAA